MFKFHPDANSILISVEIVHVRIFLLENNVLRYFNEIIQLNNV